MTHIPDEAVQAKRHLIQSYDWFFKSTGVDAIDDILSSIADAAESYHNTSQWKDEGHIDRIQKYADVAAAHLSAPCAVEVSTKEERHANTARNLIINQTSTDLENIINGHDPEQSILNNDVWDRLDKMACEIEALTNPVDVAAVRKQALEDACNVIDGYSEYDQPYCCSGHMCGCYGATVHQQMQHYIRALSAEPAQGDTAAARDVLAERRRQIESKGFDASHDDINTRGQIATAAGCYILHDTHLGDELEIIWPWDFSWWKPTNRRRDLVKAGALILAEIERLDRAAPTTEAGK